MRLDVFAGVIAAVVVLAGPALADVKASAPDGLVFQYKGQIPLAQDAAWKRLVAVGSWWSDEHTFSGKASSMTVDAVAGGCWCEMWTGGEIEHGRVMLTMPTQTLRFATALGPLQGTGVSAAMTWTLADGPAPGTTSVTLDYNVVGSSLSNLAPMAGAVDGVLQEQFNRFLKPAAG